MKKLSIMHTLASDGWGGREQHISDLSTELTKRGHSVCIGAEGHLVPRFSEAVESFALPLPEGWKDLYTISRMVYEIRRRKIDIIHSHGGREKWLALAAIKIAGRGKLIFSRHTVLPPKTDGVHHWFHQQVGRVICVSNRVRLDYATPSMTPHHHKIVVVHNGIDHNKFISGNGQSFRDTLPIAKNIPLLGYAGRVSGEKGVEHLLDAAHLLRQKNIMFHVVIAGDGPSDYRKRLDDQIRQHGLENHVTFCGFLKNPADFMNALDIFVLPCVWEEAFGLVLCEAMVCGKPVITTDRGAQPEIIQHGKTGYLVPIASAQSIADCAEQLLLSPDLRLAVGQAAKQTVLQHFTLQHMTDRMEACYHSLLSEKETV